MTNENDKSKDMLTSAGDKSESRTEQDGNIESNTSPEEVSQEQSAVDSEKVETPGEQEETVAEVEQVVAETASEVEEDASSVQPEQDGNIESNTSPEEVSQEQSAVDSPKVETPEEQEETVAEVEQAVTETASEAEEDASSVQPEQDAESLEVKAEETTVTQPANIDNEATEQATQENSTDGIVKEEEASTTVAAALPLNSEEDLPEKNDEPVQEEEVEEEVDYTVMSKAELVEIIKELSHDDKNIDKADRESKKIKPLFDQIQKAEKDAALAKFIADDGKKEDFDYKYDELDNRFDANMKLIRDKKAEYARNREKQKDLNLKQKEDILERLRAFVDSDETNISFEKFKELQEEWRNVGPIPGAQVKTLWANYNALVDRFYDNRSIYFELKELDRRKNLESKLELCEKAEKLASLENLKEAIKQLNELHHEFKHIGPVPQSDQEALWQRFKAASDAVYSNRKEFVDKLKVELEENLKVKEQLAEEVQVFIDYDSDRIKEWNAKTKEVLELQKRWEAAGGLPRAKAKEVNRKFWNAFKKFFHNKSEFFKKLDAKREENLEKKKEMVAKAVEMKDDTDWQKTTNLYKRLQADWREIGPVPEKYRESIYKEFKAACDHFFDQKRAGHGEVEKGYEENLSRKYELCQQIVSMAESDDKDMDKFRAIQASFNEIGFVPRKSMNTIKSTYADAVDKFINSLTDLSDEDKEKLKLENQLNKLIQGPNSEQKLYRKEQSVRKQIQQMENDIAVWRNNLEFFANSKTANKLKEEFETKIASAGRELEALKKQLKIIRTAS